MNQFVQRLVDTIQTWDEVSSAPHRYGGTEFKLGKVEIGHIHHNNAMLDIPYTVKIRDALIHEARTGLHHLLKESGWTTTYIHNEADLERGLWLMRLSYLQKYSRRNPIDPDEIARLGVSQAIKQAAFPRL